MTPTVFFFPYYSIVICSTSSASPFLLVSCLIFMSIIQHTISLTMWTIIYETTIIPLIRQTTPYTWSCPHRHNRIFRFFNYYLVYSCDTIFVDYFVAVMSIVDKCAIGIIHCLVNCNLICVIHTSTD